MLSFILKGSISPIASVVQNSDISDIIFGPSGQNLLKSFDLDMKTRSGVRKHVLICVFLSGFLISESDCISYIGFEIYRMEILVPSDPIYPRFSVLAM